MCGKAYLALRQKAGIILNLLAMMLSTGIPQLRTINDLNYVRDCVDLALNSHRAGEEDNISWYKQMGHALYDGGTKFRLKIAEEMPKINMKQLSIISQHNIITVVCLLYPTRT